MVGSLLLLSCAGIRVRSAIREETNQLRVACASLLVVASTLMLVACAGRSPLDPPTGSTSRTMPWGGTTSTGAMLSTGGVMGTGGTESVGSSGAVCVCTYTASGDDLTVTVNRDRGRTTYYLVSTLFASPVVQPIGVERADLFTYDMSIYRTLSARSLANGLIRFVDHTDDPSGPGWGFLSTCSADGIQLTQLYKDSTLYLELTRADDTTYRVDVGEWWVIGSYELQFYIVADGATKHTEIGTQTDVVSRNADGSANIAFTDLDGRRVSIDMTAYSQLAAIRVSSP